MGGLEFLWQDLWEIAGRDPEDAGSATGEDCENIAFYRGVKAGDHGSAFITLGARPVIGFGHFGGRAASGAEKGVRRCFEEGERAAEMEGGTIRGSVGAGGPWTEGKMAFESPVGHGDGCASVPQRDQSDYAAMDAEDRLLRERVAEGHGGCEITDDAKPGFGMGRASIVAGYGKMIETEFPKSSLEGTRESNVLGIRETFALGVAGSDDDKGLRQTAMGQLGTEAGLGVRWIHGSRISNKLDCGSFFKECEPQGDLMLMDDHQNCLPLSEAVEQKKGVREYDRRIPLMFAEYPHL